MIIWIATAERAIASYSIDAIGDTKEMAEKVCIAAVRRERKRLGWPPYEYEEDIQAVGPLRVGEAYLDMGRAGEVKR